MRFFFHLILNQSLESITRELRVLSLEERSQTAAMQTEEKKAEIDQKKSSLKLAENFLRTVGSSGSLNNRDPFFYSNLAMWLYNQKTQYAIAARLAVFSWEMFLEKIMPEAVSLIDILPLGACFFEAPYQLSGFLTYMINQGVTPAEIVTSQLLQHYFEVESVVAMDELQETYALIPESQAANDMKQLFATIPAPVQAFINHPSDNAANHLSSLNIMGERFWHDSSFVLNKKTGYLEGTLIFENTHPNILPALFQLFGWEMIKSLNLESDNSVEILLLLLNTHHEKITHEFPLLSLRNEISLTTSQFILSVLEKKYVPDHFDAVIGLIEKDPFYLHLYIKAYHDQNPLPEQQFFHYMNTLISDTKYTQIRQLYFLNTLSKFLDKHYPTHALSQQLKENIFQLLLTYDTGMPDVIFEEVVALDGLETLAVKEIEKYRLLLFPLLEQFVTGEIDFFTVVYTWENYQSHVNDFLYFDNIEEKIDYPLSIYALKARIVEVAWQHAVSYRESFDLSSLLDKFCIFSYENDKQKNQEKKRTVQEMLLAMKNLELIQGLKKWVAVQSYGRAFYQMPFGDNDCLIEKAIGVKNTILFDEIKEFIKPAPDFVYRLLIDILETKQYELVHKIDFLVKNQSCFQYVCSRIYLNDIENFIESWTYGGVSTLFQTLFAHKNAQSFLLKNKDLFAEIVKSAASYHDDGLMKQLFLIIIRAKPFKQFCAYFKVINAHTTLHDLQLFIADVSRDQLPKKNAQFLEAYFAEVLTDQDEMMEPKESIDEQRIDREEDLLLLGAQSPFSIPMQDLAEDNAANDGAGLPTPMAETAAQLPIPFSYSDYWEACQNEHYRYAHNASQVAYVLEKTSHRNQSTTEVQQFSQTFFQQPFNYLRSGDPVPEVVEVNRCDPVWLPNGKMGMRAWDQNGTEFVSRRKYHFSLSVNDQPAEEYTFYPLSPKGKRSYFCGPMPLKSPFNQTEAGEALKEKAAESCVKKGGDQLIVRTDDIPTRATMTRNPDQKDVMGKKGIDCYQECHDVYRSGLSPELAHMLLQSAQVMHLQTLLAKERKGEAVDPAVREGVHRDKLLRTELLHRHSYTLHRVFSYLFLYKNKIYRIRSKNLDKVEDANKMVPETDALLEKARAIKTNVDGHGTHDSLLPSHDPLYQHPEVMLQFAASESMNDGILIEDPLYIHPQRKDNLGAARACHNTDMMVLERIAKWFLTHVRDARATEVCGYDMLLDTEVVKQIHFVVSLVCKQIHIQIKQEINALEINPEFPKASDLGGLLGILMLFMHNVQPAITEKTRILPNVQALERPRITLFQSREPRESQKRAREMEVNEPNRMSEAQDEQRELSRAASF